MHVNVETQMSYIVTSERTMSPTGLFIMLFCCVSLWHWFLFLDCFINETTKSETNETVQFAKLSHTFYACIANASQVCLLLPLVHKI